MRNVRSSNRAQTPHRFRTERQLWAYSISVAVMDADGKLIMESLLETTAAMIVEFIQGLHGTVSLTFEAGTSAGWTIF